MKTTTRPAPTPVTQRALGKRRLLTAGVAVCLAAWLAFAMVLVLGIEGNMRLIMLTIALLLTEGVVWLSAAVLGITAFQMRMKILHKLVGGGRSDVR